MSKLRWYAKVLEFKHWNDRTDQWETSSTKPTYILQYQDEDGKWKEVEKVMEVEYR